MSVTLIWSLVIIGLGCVGSLISGTLLLFYTKKTQELWTGFLLLAIGILLYFSLITLLELSGVLVTQTNG